MNMSCSQTTVPMRDVAGVDLWRLAPVGLAVFDTRLLLEQANPAFEQLCGENQGDLRGSYLLHLLPLDADRLPAIMASLKLRSRWQGIARDAERALRIEMTRLPQADGHLQYAVSVIDYAEDLRLLREQSAARELAERTDRIKSRFLSHMSHELRTPLNAILGFTQVMQTAEDLSDVQQDNLREIANAGSYLLGLINEILDLSRIEAGNLQLHADNLLLQRLLQDCLVLLQPMTERKQVEVTVRCSLRQALKADQVRLKQVLLNLLSNAVKYNHQGGKVQLSCFQVDACRLRIEISDNGPGIRHDIQASIFSPFARLAADAQNSDSAGIGLMITRRLVQLMGGRIGLCSEPGHGSVFWLELPLEDGPGNTAEAPRAALPTAIHLLSIGNDPSFNRLLQRLQTLRNNLHLHCMEALPEGTSAGAIPVDCVLLRGSPAPALRSWPAAGGCRAPRLVCVDDGMGAAVAADGIAVLPALPSLQDLLRLIDDLAQPQQEALPV